MKRILVLLSDVMFLVMSGYTMVMAANIIGGSGDDTLPGTADPDTIYGAAGNDRISGRGANDFLRGGPGNDTIYGRDGDDTIKGGAGNDVLKGGPGNDSINGNDGIDTAVFSGHSGDYDIDYSAYAATGILTVTDLEPADGDDGTDTLLNIEVLGFNPEFLDVPVVLSSFVATVDDNMVRLSWLTGSEIENLGFHVYRSLNVGGEYERLTSTIIEGAGSSPTTSTYEFVDQGVQAGQVVFYRLEQINFDGTKEVYDLVVLGMTEATAVQPSTWGAVKSLLK